MKNQIFLLFSPDCTLVSHIPKKEKNVTLASSMHFDDAVNVCSQKLEIIEYYNQTKSGVDTVDQMVGTYNVARNTRRWPMIIFYTVLNIAGINAQIIHMLNQNVKVRRRVFIKNLVTQLVSDHMRRRSDIITGIHNTLQIKLQNSCGSDTENSNRHIKTDAPMTSNK